MTRLLSLPGFEMSDATQRGGLQSYGEELQTLKYATKSSFSRRKPTKRHSNRKTIEPVMTTINAEKITTLTMATNTSKYTIINDSVEHPDTILLALLLSLGAVVLLIGVTWKCWHPIHRRLTRSFTVDDNSPELTQLTQNTHSIEMGKSNDQQTATSLKHMDGGKEEYTGNKSRHELTVTDNVSDDKIQPSIVSNAEEQYIPMLGGNSSPTELTQFKKSNDHQTITSYKQLVKEYPYNLIPVENVDNLKISIVQPLTGPVQQQNKEYLSSSRFNWDEIFRFLAKNQTASDHKLFFSILYGSCHHLQGGGDRDTGSYIENVETRVRKDGGDSETLMFELFNQWKQIMGSNVSTEYIEEALRERSNNLLLEKFKEFMRMPPLLPRIPERGEIESGLQTMQGVQENYGRLNKGQFRAVGIKSSADERQMSSLTERKKLKAYIPPKNTCIFDGRLIKLEQADIDDLSKNNTIPIGQGSFGKVFKSENPSKGFGMHIVVKKIPLGGEGQNQSIIREMMASRIMHPFILPLLAVVDRPEGKPEVWFVSPRGNKGDLHGVIQYNSEDLNMEKRIKILLHIALAIQYIHTEVSKVREAVLHKDIASRNIVLDDNYNARLIDFGLARETSDTTSKASGRDFYAHPEIGKGGHAKEAWDYFAFGVSE